MKKKKVIHKRTLSGWEKNLFWHMCANDMKGFDLDDDNPRCCRLQWRWVTCPKCLKEKPKKGEKPGYV